MRPGIRASAVGAVLGLSVLWAVAQADEEKVPLDKVPKAVLKAVQTRFPGAKIHSAEKETEGGKTVYEIALTDKDQKVEVTLTPEGTITEIEKQVVAKDLPQAVSKALKDKYPGATYQMIEEVIKVDGKQEKLAYYEVLLVTAAKKKWEVSVAPNGKITKEEDKSKEKED